MEDQFESIQNDLQAIDDRVAGLEDRGRLSGYQREKLVCGVVQVSATLLLAEQVKRVADVLEAGTSSELTKSINGLLAKGILSE